MTNLSVTRDEQPRLNKMPRLLFVIIALYCSAFSLQAQDRYIHIVPAPAQVSIKTDAFRMNADTRIVATNEEALEVARMLASLVQPATGYALNAAVGLPGKGRNMIALQLNSKPDEHLGPEGYALRVTDRQVLLFANAPQGLFYGVQTLLQLLPPQIESETKIENVSWTVPAVDITDYPRFSWRGLMLDVSRHFFSKNFLLRYIDEMAKYKFNVFHLHLSDDQGWRVEIKGLPALTEKGAWRVPRQGKWWSFAPPQPGEEATYGGFYTQEDIREIVRYAQERFITIVPEIDLPAHSLALITAYPELSCTKQHYAVNPGSRFKGEANVVCVASDSTWLMLDKIFTQVAALFPGEYIHVGGDEANWTWWNHHDADQALMREKGLKSLAELQSYFIKRLEKIVLSKGKKLIGWDEILEGGLAPNATVMSWRGMQGGVKAAQMGHHVVMTPTQHAYLDLYQGDPLVEPETYSMLRLQDCYRFEPVPEGVNPELILGGQGNLWAESVPTERHAEYMTWPRAMALSEVLWSPKGKRDWQDFLDRLEWKFQCMDYAKVNYSTSHYDPIITAVKDDDGALKVKLATQVKGLDVYYTFNETNPDTWQQKYEGVPLSIPKGASQIKVRSFRNGQAIGQQINCPLSTLEERIEKK